ncbi:hypothetical protein ABFX02_04G135500 [Erythranthe guttata]
MTYETIFARGLSGRLEKKNMGFGAFMGWVVIVLFVCVVVKPYIGPLPFLSLEQSITSGLQMFMGTKEGGEPQQSWSSIEPIKVDNLTNSRSQVYEMYGDIIRIHGNSSTIFVPSIQQHTTNSNWTTKPYARLDDNRAMKKVREFTIIHQTPGNLPHCTRNFTSPAIIFSTGGYAGNNYHDFADVLIPLYSTSQQFHKNVIFLVADIHSYWTYEYKLILDNLSEHDIIDIDKENEVLCFPRLIVGLKANKELSIDRSLQFPHISTTNFTNFIRNTYSSERKSVSNECKKTKTRGPRLLIISRNKTRHLTNEDKVANMARSMGFKVVVREIGWEIPKVAKFVNSFDVMIGVHGAGLTNMVFLPEKAVLIQIVPFALDSAARFYYEEPTKGMNLRYLEYKVSLNESSLFGKYPIDSDIYRNPDAMRNKGWLGFKSIYMDNQDVNVDLDRFRITLLKALELVCR